MAFIRENQFGQKRYALAVTDCTGDKILVEQSHVKEVDINRIIKRHGIDLIQKTAMLQKQDFVFDDVSGNDFEEAQFKIAKAKQSFNAMPSQLRKQFDNNPAKFLDFVQNPENTEKLVEMGLATQKAPTEPIKVLVTNPEPVSDPIPETPV